MIQLDALGPDGAYRTRNRLPLVDVSGRRLGEMSQVPPLFVDRSLSVLRDAKPLPADNRAFRTSHRDGADGEPGDHRKRAWGLSSRTDGHARRCCGRLAGSPDTERKRSLDTAGRPALHPGCRQSSRGPCAVAAGRGAWLQGRCQAVAAGTAHAAPAHSGPHRTPNR